MDKSEFGDARSESSLVKQGFAHLCRAETPTPGQDRAAGFQAPGPTRLGSGPEPNQSPRRPP